LATYFVTTTADTSGGICVPDNQAGSINCSIRDAIEAANATVGVADRIEIPTGVYSLSLGPLDSTEEDGLDFVGTGATSSDVVIDAKSNFRVFSLGGITSVPVSISGMTIQNGAAGVAPGDDDGGGGIFADSTVQLTVSNVDFIDNRAVDFSSGPITVRGAGGAIEAFANLVISNSRFQSNTADFQGGAIVFRPANEAVILSISGSSFAANTSGEEGGAILVRPPGGVSSLVNVSLTNTNFNNNVTGNLGGALGLNQVNLTVTGGLFDSNQASNPNLVEQAGGAIAINGSVTITGNTVFRNNQSGRSGGALAVQPTSSSDRFTFTGTTFSGNVSGEDGGGLFVNSSSFIGTSVRLDTVTFNNGNVAADSGGGAYIFRVQTVDILNSIFNGNIAKPAPNGLDGVGGGLYIRDAFIDINNVGGATISGTNFFNNQADRAGGGAIILNSSSTISNSDFISNDVIGNGANFAEGGGGLAIHSDGLFGGIVGSSTSNISDSEFRDNVAPAAGAISSVDSTVTLLNSVLDNNRALATGVGAGAIGAIRTIPRNLPGDLDLIVLDSTVTNNRTNGLGGGIGTIDASIFVRHTTIDNNQANGGSGGGIGIMGTLFSPFLTVQESTISRNASNDNGGGLALIGTALTLINTTISNNSATNSGGGIAFSSSDPTATGDVSFATIASNSALIGSNVAVDSSVVRFLSTIVADPLGPDPVFNFVSFPGTISSQGFNLVSDNSSSFASPSDLIGVDPRLGPLANNTGPVLTRALLTGSPAIDAGANTMLANDARRISRPQDGDGNGSSIRDIGAFEAEAAVAGSTTLSIADVSVNESAGTVTITVVSSSAFAGGFTVQFATDGSQSATTTTDFQTATGSLTFAGNVGESQTFTVPIISDQIVEGDETFLIRLSNPSSSSVDVTDTGVVTIVDDDSATLTLSDPVIDPALGTVTVVVTVDRAVQGGFAVDYITQNDTATSPSDFTAVSGTLTFAGTAGDSETVVITLAPNTPAELNETFAVVLSNARSLLSVPPIPSSSDFNLTDQGIVTILGQPASSSADLSVTLTASPNPVLAGGTLTYTVTAINNGPDSATDFGAVLSLPSGASFVSGTINGSAAGVSTSGNLVIGNLLSFASGGTATMLVTVSLSPAVASPLIASVSVSANESDSNSFNNVATVATNVTTSPTGRSIIGHLFCDANGNGAEDSGEFVAGAEVFIDTNRNRTVDSGERLTVTDSAGNYRFDNVTGTNVVVAAVVPLLCNTIPARVGVARTSLDVGELARSIVAADIDSDNDLDLIVASDFSNSVTVLENNAGNFQLMTTISVVDRPQSVALWQRSASGPGSTPVVAVAGVGRDSDSGGIDLFENGSIRSLTSGNGPIDVVMGDFDSDGSPDVVSASFRSSDLSLHLSSESSRRTISSSRNVRAVAVGQFDFDSEDDIVLAGGGYAGESTSELKLLSGNGSGSFTETAVATLPRDVISVVASDLDFDFVDEVFALSTTGVLQGYRFTSSGFSLFSETLVGAGASSLAFGRFNSDSFLDVAVANVDNQSISLFVGDSNGAFRLVSTVSNVTAPSDIVVADLDGDGLAEIAVANLYQQLPEFAPATNVFRTPSTVTILKLNIAEQELQLTQATTIADVALPSASIRLDVNRDTSVTAGDALEVIAAMRLAEFEGEQNSAGHGTRHFADVDGDGHVSAVDALMIINYLSRQDLDSLYSREHSQVDWLTDKKEVSHEIDEDVIDHLAKSLLFG
jgi:uncharacterized repeat protein (TIGR01451 family)/CSLREA domain-containing protein